jgi:hypothetical protein
MLGNWTARCGVAFLFAGFVLGSAVAEDDPEGHVSLFLSYKCPVEHRVAFRAHMGKAGVNEFESWKKQGVFSDYQVLFSSFAYADDAAPDMVVRLDFARFADVARWKAVERERPAGLSAEALTMCRPQDSHLARMKWQGAGEKRDLSKAAYIRIPVHYKVSAEDYAKYFESYVKPQYDGWVAEGTLGWWGAYINYLTQGDVWDMMVLYEYRDLTALALRYEVREKVRARLRRDPAWQKQHETKVDVREFERALPMDVITPKP